MRNEPTVKAFVEAGLAVLVEHPETLLNQGLRTEDVLARVHLARATFHRTFSNRSGFLDEVADALLPKGIYTADQFAAAIRDRLMTNGMHREAALQKLVADNFGRLTESNVVTKRLLANLILGANGRKAVLVKADYERRDGLALAAFEAAFGRVGGSLRRPLNKRTFPVLLIAVMDGLLLRQRIDPDAVPAHLLVDALLTLLGAAVDVGQNFEPIVDAVARVETERGRDGQTRPLNMRAAIVEAARVLFADRGFYRTELADIAQLADMPAPELRTVFPSKEHIVVAALRPSVTELRFAISDDLAVLTDDREIAENHLDRLARLTVTERPFADAMLAAVVQSTYGDPEGTMEIKQSLNLPAILVPAIARGQERGVFTDEFPAAEIAAGLTNALLLRCFTRRDAEAADNAAFIAKTTLRGILRGVSDDRSDRTSDLSAQPT